MTQPQNLEAISDLAIIAMTIDGEAENQGLEGMLGVASVIQNRAKFVWQGEQSARAVCLHPFQFSCWNEGPDRNRILSLTAADPFFNKALAIAYSILTGTLVDSVNGADSYQVTGTNAYWSKGLTPVKVIGNQEFYVTRGQK